MTSEGMKDTKTHITKMAWSK